MKRLLVIGAIVAAPAAAHADDTLPALPPPPPAAPAASGPAAPVDPAAAAAPAAPTPVAATVRVHVTSDVRVFLQRKGDDGQWADACSSPCDAELPIDGDYRMIGGGVDQRVVLEPRPGGVLELHVKTKSSAKTTLGAIGVSVGGVASLIGLAMAASGFKDMSLDCAHPTERPNRFTTYADCVDARDSAPTRRTAGMITLAVSALMVAGGIVLLVDGTSSKVENAAPAPSTAPRDAFVRLPTWTARAAEPSGPAAAFPLVFSGRF